ncbi:CobQ/CobB/MinD/ParA nucleotide binding domain-containing protein [Methylobacterium sp. 174MFSha1.1]|uniref:ParA family protein n=1 Tax=Methylobacterium sp. 174MFSha1.1 TaxID=1502749 RepID=UPI0008F31052|nr:ParA family protein [Methylobacterium sp. 174MFSha1.1]SFV06157.1 CobQ/CobB/MinD/ParA nucleotide binding domain-containing protein [Methylobacterium sp. 174MFSha1.1]
MLEDLPLAPEAEEHIQPVLDTHAKVIQEGFSLSRPLKFRSYAVTNLRGGVGKSSIAFNIAYELSRRYRLLIADLCPQCNLTEVLRRDRENKVTILDALRPRLLGPAFGIEPDEIAYSVSQSCESFMGGKGSYIIPGDPEMFAFPSQLYQQLQLAAANTGKSKINSVRALLLSLKQILDHQCVNTGAEIVLMDTSPFYAGGTHLAWCAADALIVPIRVDEHSIESFNLLLNMLDNSNRDFQTWNERAGGLPTPKIAAVVMTMAGSKSQQTATPDSASRMYIERACRLAGKYPHLFAADDPRKCFVVTDDFVSAGRVSGAKSIPIADLKVGSFHKVEGKRLQVNSSAARYQRELKYLASIL